MQTFDKKSNYLHALIFLAEKQIRNALLFFIPIFLFSASSQSQQILSRSKQAEQYIQNLKQGILLVRLSTRMQAIQSYNQMGQKDLAEKLAAEQADINRLIAQSFKNSFNFCRVYFFYSNYSEFILSNAFEKVVFMNYDLNPDTTVTLESGKFFVAEFARIEQDTTVTGWEYYKDKTPLKENEQHEALRYAGGNYGMSALIVRSDRLVQLSKPFPYYVKYRPERDQKKEINSRVQMLNQKLADYYNAVTVR